MIKILAIDDDELFLEILIEFLNKKGWQTISADNSLLGLQLVKEQMPDLILCDIRMGGLNGYQVLKALRQEPQTEKIPVIFLTATLTDKERNYAREFGADDCLDKFHIFDALSKAIEMRVKAIK
ncbi:MAG: response regulator [Coleofasciculus sp. S288]|nr:response regulator [Coleofasciculus sp. S288]